MEIDQIINEPIFTIMDNKGRVLLSIPRKIGIQDYTVEELFELIAEQTRVFNGEQIAKEIMDKRDGDPLTNQQAQAGFLLGLDTALEMVRGQK